MLLFFPTQAQAKSRIWHWARPYIHLAEDLLVHIALGELMASSHLPCLESLELSKRRVQSWCCRLALSLTFHNNINEKRSEKERVSLNVGELIRVIAAYPISELLEFGSTIATSLSRNVSNLVIFLPYASFAPWSGHDSKMFSIGTVRCGARQVVLCRF